MALRESDLLYLQSSRENFGLVVVEVVPYGASSLITNCVPPEHLAARECGDCVPLVANALVVAIGKLGQCDAKAMVLLARSSMQKEFSHKLTGAALLHVNHEMVTVHGICPEKGAL